MCPPTSRHPEVLWAQRSDKICLTISLPDAKDVSVKCEPPSLFSFCATGAQGEKYECKLQLFGSVPSEHMNRGKQKKGSTSMKVEARRKGHVKVVCNGVVKQPLARGTYCAQYRKSRRAGGKDSLNQKRRLPHTSRLTGIDGVMKMMKRQTGTRVMMLGPLVGKAAVMTMECSTSQIWRKLEQNFQTDALK